MERAYSVWTVRAKFRVQSAKCTQCVDSGPEISQWLSRFFSSFRASSPLWESNPWPYLTQEMPFGFWTKENHIQSYLSVVL